MTYQFPQIRHVDDLLAHVSHLDYLVLKSKEDKTQVYSYIYTDKDSFATEWERECRGITFDKNGNIISRTLHKFFNLGERDAYRVENLDFTKVKAIFTKLDGSMISSYLLDGKVTVKSKNSHLSDVAVAAQEFVDARSEYIRFCTDLALAGQTPTFEFTSPNNRIVVKYDETKLTLLQVRDNVTGAYLDIQEVSKGYDIEVLSASYQDGENFSALLQEIETMEGVEGFIVMFEDGDMVKIKTPWYIGLHHTVTFKRYRDIARLVLNNTLDDFRGFLALQGYDAVCMDTIDSIEHDILEEIRDLKETVATISEDCKAKYTVDGQIDFGQVAKDLQKEKANEKYLRFVMNYLRGKESDYFYFYEKNLLRQRWGLETIPTGTEKEEVVE